MPKNGGLAKPEPKPVKFAGGAEPLGAIEVYAYVVRLTTLGYCMQV
jgi:hypothetical protein